MWQSLQSIGTQANEAAVKTQDQESAEDAIGANKVIAEQAFIDTLLIPKDWSTAQEGVDYFSVAENIILTISKVSTYGEYVNYEILQQLTETLEQMLRVKGIIQLIEQDLFADAIGNLMSQLADRAYIAQIQSLYGTANDP